MKKLLGYMFVFFMTLVAISVGIWYFVLHKRPISLRMNQSGTVSRVTPEPSVLIPAKEYDYIDQGVMRGGTLHQHTMITQIRFGVHPRFERIVIETENADPTATPLSRPGAFELVRDAKDPMTVRLKLFGYAPVTAPLPSLAKSRLLRSIAAPRSGVLLIHLRRPALFKAYTLTAPARIVIDFEPVS